MHDSAAWPTSKRNRRPNRNSNPRAGRSAFATEYAPDQTFGAKHWPSGPRPGEKIVKRQFVDYNAADKKMGGNSNSMQMLAPHGLHKTRQVRIQEVVVAIHNSHVVDSAR
jgi:hypothetical protein